MTGIFLYRIIKLCNKKYAACPTKCSCDDNNGSFAFVNCLYRLLYLKHEHRAYGLVQCTRSVQKVLRILNFRGLRIFDLRFFCGVMLILMSLTYADKFGHFECSVNF